MMEELNACDSGTTLHNSVSRFGFIEKDSAASCRYFIHFSDLIRFFIGESSVAATFI